MIKPKPVPLDDLPELAVTHIPGVTVTTEDEFRAAVRKGIASFKAGPVTDIDMVEAAFDRAIQPIP